MRKSIKILAGISAIIAGLAIAPVLNAHDSDSSDGSMMGHGGMMGMMSQMSEMMESCNKMMQSMMDDRGSDRPNDQWRKDAPETERTPGQNG